jgi:hypothetical protein
MSAAYKRAVSRMKGIIIKSKRSLGALFHF